MRLAGGFSSPNNFTVDRSKGVQSITGGFVSSSNAGGILGNTINSQNSDNNSSVETTYTKKVTIPNGGVKLKLTTELPTNDIEVNGNKNIQSVNQQTTKNQLSSNSNGFSSGVQQNYGVTNTQIDRLKNEGFEDNFKTYSFGGIVFDSSVKK